MKNLHPSVAGAAIAPDTGATAASLNCPARGRPAARGAVASLAALALWAGLPAGAQAEPERALDVRVTDEITTGSFAAPTGTPLQSTTLRLRYGGEHWSAQAELPWRRVAGTQAGGLPPVAYAGQGRGDLRLKLGVPLRAAARDATGLDLVVRMKTGSAPAVAGLGTSDAGQAVHLELLRPLGAWTAFGHAGWRRAGDLPGASPGRHAWEGEIGAARRLTPRLEAGAFVDLRQRMPTADALPEASLYAGLHEGDWRWDFFVGRSLGRERNDVSAGLALRAGF